MMCQNSGKIRNSPVFDLNACVERRAKSGQVSSIGASLISTHLYFVNIQLDTTFLFSLLLMSWNAKKDD